MSNVPKQIGNYILDKLIGRGASSEVWLAHHHHLPQRQVAIKVLMSQDRESVARFSREASIAARLQHPNIVRLYDYGLYEPFHCSVFQYVAGGSLADFLERHGQVELNHALVIFRDIAEALDYAHGLDVVHRDVSPGNMLLVEGTGRAMLTDFGIAREPRTSQLTTMSAIMGTPGFWSPEHLKSATAVTRLSDLYSLGVVLYLMLSGKMPWDELPDSPKSVFQPPLPLKERGIRHLPTAVDRVLQTMLAVDPAKRYPTAKTALEDLDRIFARHTRKTEIVHGNGEQSAADGEEGFEDQIQADGSVDDVEHALGPDCLRAPIVEAQERAAALRRPASVAALLDAWSQQGRLRRRHLGRQAKVHQSTSYNIYFYELRLLFERRTAPELIEEPDAENKNIELQREADRWEMPLPGPQGFGDTASGREVIPGSAQVMTCGTCKGKGKTVCPTCGGSRRVSTLRPVDPPPVTNSIKVNNLAANTASTGVAATPPAPLRTEEVLVPCPQCAGHGGLRCDRCEGVGRLLAYKTFRWDRWAWEDSARTTLENEQHASILQVCDPREIYREQATNGIRAEWKLVSGFRSMIEQAMAETPDDARIILSEAVVSFVPATDIVFDIGQSDKTDPEKPLLHSLTAYGFENHIPNDWNFLNWDRAILIFGGSFLMLLTVISCLFAYFT